MTLPADSHVHSEWSWDTGGPHSEAAGRMRKTCAQAVRIGLPALFFTEHLDIPGTWRAQPQDLLPHQRHYVQPDGRVEFAPLDVDGYFDSIDRMRHEFPELRILTGIEFGQPHLFEEQARALVDLNRFDRVNGSLHTLDLGGGRAEPSRLMHEHPADEVMNAYLDEIPVMVAGSDAFDVFTHIDYALRHWPADAVGPFDPRAFEHRIRTAMRAIAESGRALELNTRRLWSWVPQWWAEEGGQAVSFASDAHTPDALARHFPEAVILAEHFGFRPGAAPADLWRRG
ncbi:PHP domain-containing protein [Leifsonia sp. fls2-241-R2A-40a]|uniref:PHP domain-containing protein n=1 Tax=Leifsonia sp. fls2-241-R2A-40a TaxID=3040290 RepID=UPI0025514780|nr:PHP domain-containing protein [Leifsonia sp. fls2-241-R2A-40a]